MAAHQAPPSLGSSRQEHWSGLPFPSPMHESERESEVAQSCLTLSDPMDCSPPGSSVHGIFQARVLEWGAIAVSTPSPRLLQSPFYCFWVQLSIYTCEEQYSPTDLGNPLLPFYIMLASLVSCLCILTF